VATGRRRRTAQLVLQPLTLPLFLVSSQGAAVWDDGTLLHESHLPARSARAALEIARSHGLVTVVIGNATREDVLWVDGQWEANERVAGYLRRNLPFVRPICAETFTHDPIQLLLMDARERLEAVAAALAGHAIASNGDPAPQTGPAPDHPLWRVIFSHGQFSTGSALEVVGPTTSKAEALQFLCGHIRIAPDQIVAFGDHINDVEMLRFAGLGVAMGNASADARAAADRVAPTNDEDGIAAVLEEIGLAG
jgi:HAD superfamily hydrolase (TIGR01484 family)